MTDDDLRTRAVEAAEEYEPLPEGFRPETASDYVSIGKRIGFIDGALWHATQQPGREFGIMRPAPAPDLSGRPRFVQIVHATFPTFEQAVDACHRVPALMGKPAIICVRTAPGEWTEADR